MDGQAEELKEAPYVISGITKETPDVYAFELKPKEGSMLDFKPGMFLMLTYKNGNEKIARAYSIASAPGSEAIRLYIHMVNGMLTSKLANAKVGDIYYVSGPYGQFKFDESKEENKKILLVAGGTGIAPFMSFMEYIKKRMLGIDVALIYSVRYPNEIIARKELDELKNAIKLKLTVTVTRPQEGDGWSGETGHINEEMVKRNVPDAIERTAYLCGPLAFVNAMNEVFANIGIPKERVKADVWG